MTAGYKDEFHRDYLVEMQELHRFSRCGVVQVSIDLVHKFHLRELKMKSAAIILRKREKTNEQRWSARGFEDFLELFPTPIVLVRPRKGNEDWQNPTVRTVVMPSATRKLDVVGTHKNVVVHIINRQRSITQPSCTGDGHHHLSRHDVCAVPT